MKKILAITMLLSLLFNFTYATETDSAKPLLTIGCLSDIHNQNSMINANIADIRIRQSFLTTLDSMQREGVDMLVLGGDYTSDVTISEAQWKQVRDLMVNATRNVFQAEQAKPVIYLTGNHDYEVANFDALPKQWNAADYYNYPMKEDIGELSEDDCYYETADNSTSEKMRILAAFHYVVGGFDFVVLNPGKYFFASAWDYQVTNNAANWIDRKLPEIYSDNPEKTVFFLHHLPLPSQNGVQSGKTLQSNAASTTLLEKVLSKHKNLIYLYGHDHSTSNSFIRQSTRQRVTEYDLNGKIIKQQAEPQEPVVNNDDTVTITDGRAVYLCNTFGQQPCLQGSTGNLKSDTEAMRFVLKDSKDGFYTLQLAANGQYINCGGTFSLSSTASDLKFFRLTATSKTESPWVTGVRVTKKAADLDLSEQYIIVGTSGDKDYVMSDENKSGKLGSSSSIKYPNDSTFTYTSSSGWYNASASATNGIIWQISEAPASGNTGQGTDISTPQQEEQANDNVGMVTCFMGSMRYNSFDSNSSPGTSDSPVIQALMVYVYSDSIVLQMKNYGKTGSVSGSAISAEISNPLKPYVIKRTVVGATNQNTGIVQDNTIRTRAFFLGNTLMLTDAQPGDEIKLYDLAGRCLYKNIVTSNAEQFDIDNVADGIMFVCLTDKNGKNTTLKTIK